MRSKVTLIALATAVSGAALLPNLAHATLGAPEVSAQNDSQTLKGSIKSTQRVGYRVHEIQLPSGTTVREFAVAGGQVFAVQWRGPSMPNLRQTLGDYFDTYVGAQGSGGSRNHLRIEHSNFVAHASGHMRSFSGLAYLPLAVPAGVNIGDLD